MLITAVEQSDSVIHTLLLLLLLSRFSRVRLCNPIDGSPQAPPSLGFSRQEHWSGSQFPSPMHEGEKWRWSCSVLSNSEQPHGLQPTGLLRPWDFPGIYIYIIFHNIFHYGLWQDIEYSSLCCIVRLCCLFILYMCSLWHIFYIYQFASANLKLPGPFLSHLPHHLATTSLFTKSGLLFLFHR